MRLIDADAVCELFEPFTDAFTDVEVTSAYVQTLTLIHAAPSIDIVRCRECKWFDKDNLEDTYCTWSKGLCDAKPDDFCSYGERKESE